jgi:hypothetical protein
MPSRSLTFEEISEVLLKKWDPIGVSDVPEAADEYDGYVGHVWNMLEQGRNAEALAQYLDEVASARMGLSPHHDTAFDAAQTLFALANGDH